MLLETTTTIKKMVEVSFPLYAKDEEFNRLYYVSKRKDIVSLQVWPGSGMITIENIPFLPTVAAMEGYTTHKTTLKRVAQLPNIRPAEFWDCLDQALASLQETAYIDRGNLFK